MREIKLFDIVKSLAGHDKDALFVVSEIVDKNFCKIIDGKMRSISNPKLKKYKHLQYVATASELADSFNDKSKTNDARIRKILKNQKEIEENVCLKKM